jgi:hypothetical protein
MIKSAVKYIFVMVFGIILGIFISIKPAYASALYYSDVPLSEETQTYLYNRCQSEGISFDFMLGLIEQESEFNRNCISPTGDYGLCQINVAANQELIEKKRIYSILDEYHNIDCAIEILVDLFEKYEEPSLVLMCYNMGKTTAQNLWRQGRWESKYSVSVLQKAWQQGYDNRLADFYYHQVKYE